MIKLTELLEKMHTNPADVRFTDLCRICDHFFGAVRQTGGSHRVYRTPWTGDPRVNVQNRQGKAKAYQVRQIIKAIERLEVEYGSKK